MSDESKSKHENRNIPPFSDWREYRGLDQKDIARLLKTSQASVSRWETGQTQPNIDQMIELSRVLNASLDDILTRTPQKPSAAMEVYLELRYAPDPVQRRALKLVKALIHDHEDQQEA